MRSIDWSSDACAAYLRDFNSAIGLDADGNDALSWGEVRQAQARIDQYALSHLVLRADGMNCARQITQLRISEHADGHYAALDLDGHCPQAVQALTKIGRAHV